MFEKYVKIVYLLTVIIGVLAALLFVMLIRGSVLASCVPSWTGSDVDLSGLVQAGGLFFVLFLRR